MQNLSAKLVTAWSFNNAPSRTIQTVAAAANGWQISSTRAAGVSYSVTTSATGTIGVTANATVVIEVCATNSSTAGDWIEVARGINGMTLTVAVALQSVQAACHTLSCDVPAGWYCRVRSTITGTASAAITSAQEVLK